MLSLQATLIFVGLQAAPFFFFNFQERKDVASLREWLSLDILLRVIDGVRGLYLKGNKDDLAKVKLFAEICPAIARIGYF